MLVFLIKQYSGFLTSRVIVLTSYVCVYLFDIKMYTCTHIISMLVYICECIFTMFPLFRCLSYLCVKPMYYSYSKYALLNNINHNATNLPLSPASASISSKKTIAGAAALALLNTSRTARSDSPTHLLNNSGP